MKTITTSKQLQQTIDELRIRRRSIGLVPTMGFLHDGHLSLVRTAKLENDIVVTRITKYPQRDLGDIQRWGPLKTFSWLGVKTSIVISRFLLDTGIIKEGRNVVTPVTLEEGESSKFYKNYQDFIEGITALSN